MNEIFRLSHFTSLEADYARWCAEQGALLRAGSFEALDRDNLAEEIESLGRSDKREIDSRLKKLLVHLLKWQFQPLERSESWRATVREQRGRIAKVLRESPSLKAYPAEALDEEYAYARWDAAKETGFDVTIFPEQCPFTVQDVLAIDLFPDGPASEPKD